MAKDNSNNKHLIDDVGTHANLKPKQIIVFVTFCRIVTVLLIILGALALIVGH